MDPRWRGCLPRPSIGELVKVYGNRSPVPWGASAVYLRLLAIFFLLMSCTSVRAADLRVSLSELAGLLDPLVAKTQVRLHNVPSAGIFGAIFDPQAQSYLRFGDTQVALAFDPVTFPLTGIGSGRYAYYMNDISSAKISAKPVGNRLHIIVAFEDKDAELVPACHSGSCGFTRALPVMHWRNPRLVFQLTPRLYRQGITLRTSRVTVGGTFRARCRTSSFLCPIGRRWAESYANKLRRETLPGKILAELNSKENLERIAERFARFLQIGEAGTIRITALNVAKSAVRVNFQVK